MRGFYVLVLFVAFGLFMAGPGHAETPAEIRLAELEKRVAILEQQQAAFEAMGGAAGQNEINLKLGQLYQSLAKGLEKHVNWSAAVLAAVDLLTEKLTGRKTGLPTPSFEEEKPQESPI